MSAARRHKLQSDAPCQQAASRLVIIGDSNSVVSRFLVKAALEVAREQAVQVTLLCDTGFRPWLGELFHDLRIRTAWRIWQVFEPDTAPHRPRSASRFKVLSKQYGVPLLRAPGSTINEPQFLDRIRQAGVDWSLCFLSLAIFGAELLELFKVSVNYHNGRLPQYRGLRATSWSLYHGEEETGFAFHYMARSIDAGPVLLQGSVPVRQGTTPRVLDLNKAIQAATRLSEVFDLVGEGHTGRCQDEVPRYFNRAAFERITSIDRPSELTSAELFLRLRAFEELKMNLGGTCYPVTRIHRVRDGAPKPLDFVTVDGVRLRPSRVMHIPKFLYRIYRFLAGAGG